MFEMIKDISGNNARIGDYILFLSGSYNEKEISFGVLSHITSDTYCEARFIDPWTNEIVAEAAIINKEFLTVTLASVPDNLKEQLEKCRNNTIRDNEIMRENAS